MAIQLNPNERHALEVRGTHLKSFINVHQGTIYLTTERFIFARPEKGIRTWAPMLEGFVDGVDVAFQFPYNMFESIKKGRHGFASKLTIRLLSGDTFDIQVTNQDTWLSMLRDMITNKSGGHVVDDGMGGFYVMR